MKLFVHNFMSSRFLKNVTVGYPLNLVVKQFVEKDIEFDRDNTIVMLDRVIISENFWEKLQKI